MQVSGTVSTFEFRFFSSWGLCNRRAPDQRTEISCNKGQRGRDDGGVQRLERKGQGQAEEHFVFVFASPLAFCRCLSSSFLSFIALRRRMSGCRSLVSRSLVSQRSAVHVGGTSGGQPRVLSGIIHELVCSSGLLSVLDIGVLRFDSLRPFEDAGGIFEQRGNNNHPSVEI